MKRRAQLIEEGPEPEMYSDMEEMVRHDGLDAVAVVLPNYLHKRGAVAALEAGNHVLCEKPMALTVSNCNDMIAAAERNGKALQIGTQLRHRSDFKTLVEAIRKAPVGKILQSDVSTYRGDWRVPAEDEYPPGVEYWRLNQSKCGGVVYEMGAHLIDVNNWVFDSEPVSVTGIQGVNNLSLRSRDSTDHAGVVVRYANDAVMNYGGNLYNYGSGSPGYFFAVDGTVEFSGDQVTIHYRDTEQKDLPETETESLPDGDGTQGQWKYFTRVMGGEAEPYPDGYVGRQTVEICQGAIVANREGTTVEVSELERYDAPAG
jgi:predicted dehydrogenase